MSIKSNWPARLLAVRASVIKIRRYLLSHFWYYHRLWKLNYRVRDGNGCDLPDMFTGYSVATAFAVACVVVVGRNSTHRIENRSNCSSISSLSRAYSIPDKAKTLSGFPQALDTSGQAFVR